MLGQEMSEAMLSIKKEPVENSGENSLDRGNECRLETCKRS